MLFLVELDHVKSGGPTTPEAGQAFIQNVVFPTLARAEQLVAEQKILGGGPVLGRVALRFIMQGDSAEDVDRVLTSLPLWPVAETRVTPLVTFNQRREHVGVLLKTLAAQSR